jgi:hypothetical protein
VIFRWHIHAAVSPTSGEDEVMLWIAPAHHRGSRVLGVNALSCTAGMFFWWTRTGVSDGEEAGQLLQRRRWPF